MSVGAFIHLPLSLTHKRLMKCTKPCSRCRGHSSEPDGYGPYSHETRLGRGETKKKKKPGKQLEWHQRVMKMALGGRRRSIWTRRSESIPSKQVALELRPEGQGGIGHAKLREMVPAEGAKRAKG